MATSVVFATARAWKVADKNHDLLRALCISNQTTPVILYCSNSQQVSEVFKQLQKNAEREGCIVKKDICKRVNAHIEPDGRVLLEPFKLAVHYELPA